MRGNPRAFFVLHSDVCCDFPVVQMDRLQRETIDERGFVILGAEVHIKGLYDNSLAQDRIAKMGAKSML